MGMEDSTFELDLDDQSFDKWSSGLELKGKAFPLERIQKDQVYGSVYSIWRIESSLGVWNLEKLLEDKSSPTGMTRDKTEKFVWNQNVKWPSISVWILSFSMKLKQK